MLSLNYAMYSMRYIKTLLCTTIFIAVFSIVKAQVKTVAEIKNQLTKAKDYKEKFDLLNQLNVVYIQQGQTDSLKKVTKDMLVIAQRSGNDTLLIQGYMNIGTYLVGKADFEAGLEFYFKALRLAEELKLTDMMILLNNNIGGEYEDLKNFNEALKYSSKVKQLLIDDHKAYTEALQDTVKYKEMLARYRNKDVLRVFNHWHLAFDYLNLNKPDLALHSLDTAQKFILTRKLKDGQVNFINAHIKWTYAQVYKQQKNNAAANAHYQEAIKYSDSLNLKTPLVLSLNGYSDFLYQNKQYKLASQYATHALNEARKTDYVLEVINSAAVLSKVYTQLNMPDSANYYYQLKDTYQERAFNQQRISRLQDITFTEQIHQAEEQAKQAELEEQRKHNLQYAGIAIAIISFIVVFLLLSRSSIASPRAIEFLGVIGLLILFEFVNLLLHPFIGKYTHHSPLLMLGIMVAIAALLVPMHHKLEHWIKHKFISGTSGH
jgi:tetratricopeptide (TPR) repeat protein